MKNMLTNRAFKHAKKLAELRENMQTVVDNFYVYEERQDVKKLDFVLTYNTADTKESLKQSRIDEYISNLEKIGFEVKKAESILHKAMMFVLIHGTGDLLTKYAYKYGIVLSRDNPYYEREIHRGIRAFVCKVNSMTADHPDFKRAPETLSGERPREITDTERMMILFQILRVTPYGPSHVDLGLLRLLEKGVFTSAYPLHDVRYEWTERGRLSDRQILAKYWANAKCFFRRQPLNLIEKYFGSEVGFYFAFLNHYVFEMAYAGLLGGLCFMYGIMTLGSKQNARTFQICHSNVTICPICPNFRICKYTNLSSSCFSAHMAYVLDNQATVCYAVLISLWTTISMELWKRKQASLAYKWNVFSSQIDVSVRPEYEVSAHLQRLSPVTGKWEAYVDDKVKLGYICVSYTIMILLGILAVGVVVAVRFYIGVMRALTGTSENPMVKKFSTTVAAATASTLSVIIMLILEKIYVKLALVLTNLENPRTEVEYDNSYIYKRFILTFINGYAVTFYIAFFQGKFYRHPGIKHDFATHIQFDLCDPSGCSKNLAIHLVIVLLIKCFLMNAMQAILPIISSWVAVKKSGRKVDKKELPIWEEQYNLPALDRFFLVSEYQEIALQYGFVAFFSSSFTLAPIFALLHGLISIRVDGRKFITRFRRPVPVRVSGLLAWEGIFKSMTLIGVVLNAFVIGFTMDFVPRQIYNYRTNVSKGFVESTLSIFNTSDYADPQDFPHPPHCFYKGRRYPPQHPRKYQVTKEYWYELAVRIAFVIVYEQIVFLLTSILAYSIPDVPRAIQEKVEYEKTKLLKKNLAAL